MSTVHSGAIRLFAPEELLRIFGFPAWYRFPPRMKLQHRYKLIGQSINVRVVECIMRTAFWEDTSAAAPILRKSLPPLTPPQDKKRKKKHKKMRAHKSNRVTTSKPAGPAELAARKTLLLATLVGLVLLAMRRLQ